VGTIRDQAAWIRIQSCESVLLDQKHSARINRQGAAAVDVSIHHKGNPNFAQRATSPPPRRAPK
jgi:hypothetical protein